MKITFSSQPHPECHSHQRDLTLTLANVLTLAGMHTRNQWELIPYQTWGYRERCASVREKFNSSKEFIPPCTAEVSSLWRQPYPPVGPAWGWPEKRGRGLQQMIWREKTASEGFTNVREWAWKLNPTRGLCPACTDNFMGNRAWGSSTRWVVKAFRLIENVWHNNYVQNHFQNIKKTMEVLPEHNTSSLLPLLK